MPTAIDEALAQIDGRISELHAELEQLEKAKTALAGLATSSRSAARKKASRTPRAGRRMAARGDRASQFKAIVKDNPSVRPSQAAKEMGVSSQQVHGIIKRLTEKGELKRRPDKSFKLAA